MAKAIKKIVSLEIRTAATNKQLKDKAMWGHVMMMLEGYGLPACELHQVKVWAVKSDR